MKKVRNGRNQSRYWQTDTNRSYYHLMVKVFENTPGNFAYALDDECKKKLEDMLWRLDELYLLKVVSYCIMSNHVHIILVRDNKAHTNITLKQVAVRYQAYYNLKNAPDARSSEVKSFRKRINNISQFMQDFQRQFTWWYNTHLPTKRRGSLWGKTFKSVVLKSQKSLVECMKYVELNPVRAKISTNPGNYTFSSWGHIVKNDQIGQKLRVRIIEHFRYMMGQESELQSDTNVFLGYAGDLEALGADVVDNKNIKRIDPYKRAFLLEKCEHWTELKMIGGEDVLIGEGHGRRRPKIIQFKLE